MVGIGVDIVAISRIATALERTPRLVSRLFAPAENAEKLPAHSLAARFAAKEAIIKAMGGPDGIEWADCQILTEPNGRPQIVPGPTLAATAARLGITNWQVSMSHDAGIATAFVIATGGGA